MLKRSLRFVFHLVFIIGFSSSNAGSYEDFFIAIQRDDARAVDRLLARGFDPNTRSPKGQPGLTLALQQQSLAVADRIAGHPALEVDARNEAGESALMMAALKGDLAWVQRLLGRGATVQHDGWSPILYAATGPETKTVALLLDRGAALDALAPNRTTPLMMAARYGPESSVDLLLARGANPKLRNDHGMTAADFARAGGRESLAARLDALPR
jgi:ankyrin repeat protein